MKFDCNLLAAAALALALSACGSPAEEADDPQAQGSAAPAQNIDTAASDAPESATPDAVTDVSEAEATPDAGEPAAEAPAPAETPAAAAPAATPVASVEAPAMWAVCSACHAVEPGRHGLGPSLAGVFGAEAAAQAGFDYSDAMESSGLTWDEATLDRYLEDPRKVVPGTTMAYAGLKNADQRKAMIAYLKSL